MWETIQFIIILLACASALLYSVNTLPQFAIFSELLWLIIYTLCSLNSTLVVSVEIAGLPFIILVLTAVEAVIIWTLIVYGFKLKI